MVSRVTKSPSPLLAGFFMPYFHEPDYGAQSESDIRNWREPGHEAWKHYIEHTKQHDLMRLRSGWLMFKAAWEKSVKFRELPYDWAQDPPLY